MEWFNSLRLKTRLLGGFLIVAIIAGVIGAVGIWNLKKLDNADTLLYEKMTVPMEQLGNIADSFQRMRANLLEMTIADNAAGIKDMEKRVEDRRKEISDLGTKVEATMLTDEGRKAFSEFKSASKSFETAETKYVALIEAGNKAESIVLWKGEMEVERKAFQNAINALLASKVKNAKQTSDDNTIMANGAVTIMMICLVVGVLLSVFLGLLLNSSVQKQLGWEPDLVADIARKIAAGNLAIEMDTKGKDSNSIIIAMEKMVAAIRALVADAGMLSKAAGEGKLATRAEATKHQGEYR